MKMPGDLTPGISAVIKPHCPEFVRLYRAGQCASLLQWQSVNNSDPSEAQSGLNIFS
jgi:hypothetical protein